MLIYFLILFFSNDRNKLLIFVHFILSQLENFLVLSHISMGDIYLNCCNDCIKSVWKFPSLISHSFLCFFLIYLQEQNFTFKSKLVILFLRFLLFVLPFWCIWYTYTYIWGSTLIGLFFCTKNKTKIFWRK